MIKDRKLKTGNALTQYGIIIVLIALALVPVYFLTGKYIVNYFESFYQQSKTNNLKIDENTKNNVFKTLDNLSSPQLPPNVSDNDIINGNIKAGGLGGTNDKPTFKCAGNVCTIDYGDFVLNGIPSDFDGLIQSSGTSGGTDSLVALIEQIVIQAKDIEPPMEDSLIKSLSNKGHDLATTQKTLEGRAVEMDHLTWGQVNKLKNVFNDITEDQKVASDKVADFTALHNKVINAYPNPTKEQQNLIKTLDYLSTKIETLQVEMDKKVDSMITEMQEYKDNIYKNENSFDAFTKVQAGDTVYKPQYSINTHIKSGIICATGHNKDTGIQCN